MTDPTPITGYIEEIKRLTIERDELLKVVRYYAEAMNWEPLISEDDSQLRIATSDAHLYTSPISGDEYLCGGKRARELLARLEGKS